MAKKLTKKRKEELNKEIRIMQSKLEDIEELLKEKGFTEFDHEWLKIRCASLDLDDVWF